MPAMLCGSLGVWRSYVSAAAALATFAAIVAMACNVTADEPTHVDQLTLQPNQWSEALRVE